MDGEASRPTHRDGAYRDERVYRTLNYTYFPTGKVETIRSSNARGVSVAYTYDAGVPVDRSSSTGWDDLNRLETVMDNRLSGNNTTTYSYDNANNVATVLYLNGLQSTFTYDSLNRRTELSTPPVADYHYTLGATGIRTNATEQSGRTLVWNYDNIYGLPEEWQANDRPGIAALDRARLCCSTAVAGFDRVSY